MGSRRRNHAISVAQHTGDRGDRRRACPKAPRRRCARLSRARSAWERPPSRAVLRAALAAADASRARRSPSSTSTRAERRSSILICTASARPDELFDIGWDDYLARGGVCAVEWSERVSDALRRTRSLSTSRAQTSTRTGAPSRSQEADSHENSRSGNIGEERFLRRRRRRRAARLRLSVHGV